MKNTILYKKLLVLFSLSMVCFFTSFNLLASTKKPNVLLIVVDDLNDWVGHLNTHSLTQTPNIDDLALRGISFSNTHTAAPVCAASRAAYMSGVAPHKSGVYSNGNHSVNTHQAISNVPHLPELFRQQGYLVYGAGKIYHDWVSDGGEELSAQLYDDFLPKSTIMPTLDMLGDGTGYGGSIYGGDKGNKFFPFATGGNDLVKKLHVDNGFSLSAGVVTKKALNGKKMPDEEIAAWGANKLQEYAKLSQKNHGSKPFFMTIGLIRPHVPFAVPEKYFKPFPLDKIILPKDDDMKDIPLYGKAMAMGIIKGGDHKAVTTLGETYWKALIQGYLASIAFADEQVGVVLNQLKATGLDKNTIVVLTSDHGQNLGEKQNWRKMSLWEESTKVPLIVSVPNAPHAGSKISAAVSLLDLYPTLSSLLDFDKPLNADGNDLSSLLANPNLSWNKPVLTSWFYKNFAVRSNRYRLIQYRDGSEELYDHAVDPHEHTNLSNDPKYSTTIQTLRKHIPKKVALPHGTDSWQGDRLDKLLHEWITAPLK